MLDLDLCTADEFTLSRNSLRRELSAAEGLCDLRIAVLGGSTVEPMLQTLEVLLLASGFRPRFHRGEYGRFYEEAVHETAALAAFQPDLIYLHTSSRNVLHRPSVQTAESDLPRLVAAELDRWREIWDSLERSVGCQIIQNNFEPLPVALLGNMEAVAPAGQVRRWRRSWRSGRACCCRMWPAWPRWWGCGAGSTRSAGSPTRCCIRRRLIWSSGAR
jgi:predicted enzyme involved in methoxymalonyl-ACP biosynthesis